MFYPDKKKNTMYGFIPYERSELSSKQMNNRQFDS